MAVIRKDEKGEVFVEADLKDIPAIVEQAVNNLDKYRDEIEMIYDKMPKFDYKYFCFYAYATYHLLEDALGFSCNEATHFRLIAPDEFFFTFFGIIATLHAQLAKVPN